MNNKNLQDLKDKQQVEIVATSFFTITIILFS